MFIALLTGKTQYSVHKCYIPFCVILSKMLINDVITYLWFIYYYHTHMTVRFLISSRNRSQMFVTSIQTFTSLSGTGGGGVYPSDHRFAPFNASIILGVGI